MKILLVLLFMYSFLVAEENVLDTLKNKDEYKSLILKPVEDFAKKWQSSIANQFIEIATDDALSNEAKSKELISLVKIDIDTYEVAGSYKEFSTFARKLGGVNNYYALFVHEPLCEYAIVVLHDYELAMKVIRKFGVLPTRPFKLAEKTFVDFDKIELSKIILEFENIMIAKDLFGESVVKRFYDENTRIEYFKFVKTYYEKTNQTLYDGFKTKWLYLSKYFIKNPHNQKLINWFNENM